MPAYIRGNAVKEMHRNNCRMMSESPAHKCPNASVCHPFLRREVLTHWSSLRLVTVPHFFLHEAILGLPSASILWNAQLLLPLT
jgi:hypothetical protein